jgi:hypothetical protein
MNYDDELSNFLVKEPFDQEVIENKVTIVEKKENS